MHPLANVYLWEGFRSFLDLTIGLYRKRIALLHSMGMKENESVLDIGCGTGHYSVVTSGKYLGLDLEDQYIKFARRQHPHKEFSCMNVSELKLDSKRFDVALLVDIIHHLSENEAKSLFLELSRAASRIYFFEPIIPNKSNYVGRWLAANDRGQYIRSKEDLLKLLEQSFYIKDVQNLKLGPIETICALGHPRRDHKDDSGKLDSVCSLSA
jgi:2-polyprenyl-3-methyl-5-hydroxy-6-metoxy-1,4-benzoquinol methylase